MLPRYSSQKAIISTSNTGMPPPSHASNIPITGILSWSLYSLSFVQTCATSLEGSSRETALRRARNNRCSSGPYCECSSNWHLLGTSRSQSSEGRVCLPIQTCFCLWERPPKPPCTQPCPCFLQDLLTKSYMERPPMEGMFRPAAGEKAHQEMKEALNTGRCLDLENPPVYCWQPPWWGLPRVWPRRAPCGPAGITGFDLDSAPG